MFEEQCPITGKTYQITAAVGEADTSLVPCPEAGGDYRITTDAWSAMRDKPLAEEARICVIAWVAKTHLIYNNTPLIDAKVVESAWNWKIPPMPERLNRALIWMVRQMGIGEYMNMSDLTNIVTGGEGGDLSEFSNFCYIRQIKENSRNEVQFFLRSLSDLGLIDAHIWGKFPGNKSVIRWCLTTKSYERYEELQKTQGDSDSAFVAMWFNKVTDAAYNDAIEPAVKSAGYRCVRIDRQQHINKIDDEIIAAIRRARFVVADFTSQSADKPRGGVYYEAGFAHGLNRRVICTCDANMVGDLHLDIRQYNCLKWSEDDLPKFKRELQTRIEAVIGDGPHKAADTGGAKAD